MHRGFAWTLRHSSTVVLLLALGASSVWSQSYPLSTPGNASVSDSLVSPDGRYAVYVSGTAQLYSVRLHGREAPVRLNASEHVVPAAIGTSYPDKEGTVQISPDSTRVLYAADANSGSLYSVPIDGTAAPINLHDGNDPIRSALITPDGSRAVYFTDHLYESTLRSVPIDGSAAPVTLADADGVIERLQLTPDGSRAVYASSSETYSVPVDGSAARVLLAPSENFLISPDGGHALYRRFGNLYRVPVDASGAATQINAALVPGGSVSDVGPLPFHYGHPVSPDGTRVVYRADQDVVGVFELYSVPFSGGVAVKLNGLLSPGGDVERYAISPDGERVVYVADQDTDDVHELYSAPLAGGAPPVKLNSAAAAGVRSIQISPDGRRVAFTAGIGAQGAYPQLELYLAPLDASSPSIRLSDPLVSPGSIYVGGDSAPPMLFSTFQFTPDGATLVYATDIDADQDGNYGDQEDRYELFSVPVVGGSAPSPLSGPLTSGGSVQLIEGYTFFGFLVGPLFRIDALGRRIVYRADQDTVNVVELYGSPLFPRQPRARLR